MDNGYTRDSSLGLALMCMLRSYGTVLTTNSFLTDVKAVIGKSSISWEEGPELLVVGQPVKMKNLQ